MEISGKVAVITGAASGIGRATAEAVGAQGGHLVLTDLDAERLAVTAAGITASGGVVLLAEAADVSDHDAVRRLARRATDEHGPMDIVMNIAGISAWGTVAPSSTRRGASRSRST